LTKAIAYARYSSDNQREESITAQLRAIRAYAEKESIIIVEEYTDEAKSATTDNRPAFIKMLQDVSSGTVEAEFLLIHKLDRFARNRYDSAVHKRELAMKGIRVVSITEPLDGSPESIMLEALLEAMAEYYSKNLGREVIKGMKETAYQAKHTGGKPPLGYDVDPQTKQYIINAQEAIAVKLIFSLALSGKGYGQMIEALNSRGFRTKSGRSFGKNSLHDILRNEKYCGTYIFNKSAKSQFGKRNSHAAKPKEEWIIIPDAMPAIVTREEWEEVQQIMDGRKQTSPRSRGDNLYILTGKLVCGECGGSYVGSNAIAGRNKTRYYFYTCTTRKRTKECSNKDIRKEILENAVLDQIEQMFFPEKIDIIAEKLLAFYKQKNEDIMGEFDYINNRLNDINSRITKLLDSIETGTIPSEIAGPRLTELSQEKKTLDRRFREIQIRNDAPLDIDKIRTYLQKNRQVVTDRSNLFACKRVIDTYVERVIIYPEEIEIVFKFLDFGLAGGGGGNRTPFNCEPFGVCSHYCVVTV